MYQSVLVPFLLALSLGRRPLRCTGAVPLVYARELYPIRYTAMQCTVSPLQPILSLGSSQIPARPYGTARERSLLSPHLVAVVDNLTFLYCPALSPAWCLQAPPPFRIPDLATHRHILGRRPPEARLSRSPKGRDFRLQANLCTTWTNCDFGHTRRKQVKAWYKYHDGEFSGQAPRSG